MVKKQNRPTQDDEKRMLLYSKVGTMYDKELAQLLGVSISVIAYHRNKAGVKPFRYTQQKWSDEKIKEFISFYSSHTKKQCSRRYNITVNTLNCMTSVFRKKGYCIPYRHKETRYKTKRLQYLNHTK